MTGLKVFIAGAGGMLASALERLLGTAFELRALTEAQLDITDSAAVFEAIREARPDVIVNAAAYTAVDQCETEQGKAMLVNGTAVGHLARAAEMTGARIIHFSTDYIFDGEKEGPYGEDDVPNPVSAYGRSKLMGERELLRFTQNYIIIRTQWLYGENGKNFVDTIVRLARQQDELKVVDDQYGSPTYTMDLARVVGWFAEHRDIKGQVFHFSNEGVVSWFGFAREILKLAGIGTRLVPVDTSAFPRPAKRPHNSALDKTKIRRLTNIDIRPWFDALYEYMENTGRVAK
ncbi:MAG: dTDP-4-dehydrorhamnose reductase [Deltaproteobacteria bacterium]|nr:dTDP-4-dehydrorhamnose reductase [Deltaproteobacteria bacterium]MCL5277721.1 dTDP-4-dehydrorhamnose reductase [Deltaproteobacteria bacterium]